MNNADELDFAALVAIVRRYAWVILLCTALGTAAGAVVAFVLAPKYTSEAVLSPRGLDGEAGIGSLLGSYGALASVAGIELSGSAQDSNAKLALDILQSRRFVTEFAARRGIVPELMAGESWSAEDGLTLDASIYDQTTATWTRPPDPPFGVEPDAEEIFEEFTDLLAIDEDPQDGLVRISMTYISPDHARRWLSWLIADLDDYVRDLDIAEAERAILFLEEGLGETSIADVRGVFFELIEKQTEKMMLARASPEYAFRVVDPPHLPIEPSSLHPLLIVLGAFVATLLLAVIGAVLRATWPTGADAPVPDAGTPAAA